MKKIAFVTRVLRSGGAENVLRQIVEFCASKDLECLIIAVQKGVHGNFSPTVEVRELEEVRSGIAGKLSQYRQVRRIVKDFGAELVLSMPEDIGIYVILAMLGTGIPVVVSERNNPWVMPNKKVTRLLRRIAYPFAAGLIFQTRQAMSFFPAAQQKKGIVLDNPLELSRLPEPFTGMRKKIVVSAGRLDNQKNFPLLIRAFSVFHERHPEYQLVIYGEGKKRRELEQLADELLPDGAWCMPGRVEDLPERIAQCEMFVLSSDYEGVPNVLIEAMACGMPVISTDCAPGGAANLIENGTNGLLVSVGDVEALAEGMTFLAEHPQEAAQMGRNAVKLRQRLDAQLVCAQWLDYLAKAAKRNS